MGFGSYDESEQQSQDVSTDDAEGVAVHENDHEGEMRFESGCSTSELVEKLADIKNGDADEE